MIMAGGTGGHVFPALAVAARARARATATVVWLGTQRGLEARVVPPAGHRRRMDQRQPAPRQGRCSRCSRPRFGSRARSLRRSARCAGADPRSCSAMGGFVAGPGRRSPPGSRAGRCFVHEQNAIAGTTNRLLAPLATRVLRRHSRAASRRRRDDERDRQSSAPRDRAERLAARSVCYARRAGDAPARRRRQPGRRVPERSRARARSRRSRPN